MTTDDRLDKVIAILESIAAKLGVKPTRKSDAVEEWREFGKTLSGVARRPAGVGEAEPGDNLPPSGGTDPQTFWRRKERP